MRACALLSLSFLLLSLRPSSARSRGQDPIAIKSLDRDGHTFDPDAYPVEITQALMCQSCYAAVKVFVRTHAPKLAGMRSKLAREVFVYDASDMFCSEANFFDFTGFPPAFRKGCSAFVDRYNDDSSVEDGLVAGGSTEVQCKRICRAVCAGMSEAERFSEYTVEESAARRAEAELQQRSPGAKVERTERVRDAPFPEDETQQGEL